MSRDNFYIILELPFDPPEEDIIIVNQTIDKKKLEWSKKATGFKSGPVYKKYIEMVPEIKATLADPTKRKLEYLEAANIIYKELDNILPLVTKKGYILESEIVSLSKKLKIAEEIIRKRNTVEIRKDDIIVEKKESPEWDKFKTSQTYLDVLKKRNLYKFINSEYKNMQDMEYSALLDMSKELKKKYVKNDAESSAGNKLCVLCEDVFKNEESKKNYDDYLIWQGEQEVYNLIKQITETTKVLEKGQGEEVLDRLVALGIDKEECIVLLKNYCKKINVAWAGIVGQEYDNRQQCPMCHKVIVITNQMKKCTECGLDLTISCPKCKVENSAFNKICQSCGLSFNNMTKAEALCSNARIEITYLNFDLVESMLEDAKKLWPSLNTISEVRQELASQKRKVGNMADKMHKYVDDKKYYVANQELLNIQRIFPQFSDGMLENKIKMGVSQAQKYFEQAQNSKIEKDIINNCVEAYNACCDYPGVLELLSKYPPKQPIDLTISINNNNKNNYLRWKSPQIESDVQYIIVRKKEAPPLNEKDGEELGRVLGYSYTDNDITAGICYYYAIFAERAGLISKGLCFKNAIINYFDVSNATLVTGDQSIQIEWENIPTNAKVEVWKKENDIPTKHGDGIMMENITPNGFVDIGLINEKTYAYRIFAKYNIAGQEYYSEGITLKGIPVKPPKEVEYISIRAMKIENRFEVEWDYEENSEILFFYTIERPVWQKGENISKKELMEKANRLVVQKISNSKGLFVMNLDAVYYVFAVTVKFDSAIIGAMASVSNKVSVNIKNIQLSNGKLHISLDWPPDTEHVLVLHKNNQFPSSLEDKDAIRKRYSKGVFEITKTLVIDNLEEKEYYISVFAETKFGGEIAYSLGSNVHYNNAKKKVIQYSIREKKQLFSSKSVEIEFESDEKMFLLPEVIIVSCIGYPPAFKHSGNIIASIPKTNAVGKYTYTIPYNGFNKNTYLKVFIKNETDEKCNEIELKYGAKSKLG